MSDKVKDKEKTESAGEDNKELKKRSSKIEEWEEKIAQREEKIAELEERLSKKEEELESHIERIKRIQADFENYKKRIRKEDKEKKMRIENNLLLDIIPIYDNLERAFRSFQHNNDRDSFIEGVEKIFSQFDSLLVDKGVESIEAVGKRFDPAKHEALITAESDKEQNIVLEEFERGYRRDNHVLRPSRVKVSSGKKGKDDQKPNKDCKTNEEG